MSEKELLQALGLDSKTISITLDSDYQRMIEKQVDRYLQKIDEENKKEKLIDQLKDSHEEFKEKQHLIEMLRSKIVINALRDIFIREGFSYKCPTCRGVDLSGQYGRCYPKYNTK